MKKLLFLPFVIITVLIASCSSDDNNSTTSSRFEGNWSGQFTGDDDNGNWNVVVDSDGVVSGLATSNIFSGSFEINGNVNESGTLTATLGTISDGGEFIGELNGNNANGTWINASLEYEGSWTGSKQ